MACFKPLTAYNLLNRRSKHGKAKIVFSKEDLPSNAYTKIQLSCGQCIGCRIDRSRQWAVRCVHESEQWPRNCFLTLTYNDNCLPENESLTRGKKSDFSEFIKRLRKKYTYSRDRATKDTAVPASGGKIRYPIRYFQCGEYGDQLNRPHHHAAVFNWDCDDKELLAVRNGNKVYGSRILDDIWEKGRVYVGTVTWQSAAYIARYIIKKRNGPEGLTHYLVDLDPETGECIFKEPEYVTMSQKPGIGGHWWKKYEQQVTDNGYLVINGKKFRPPEYYDRLLEQEKPMEFEMVKKRRHAYALTHEHDDLIRLDQRRHHKQQQTKRLDRSMT